MNLCISLTNQQSPIGSSRKKKYANTRSKTRSMGHKAKNCAIASMKTENER